MILLVFNLCDLPHSGDAGYSVFQSFGVMAAAVQDDAAPVLPKKKNTLRWRISVSVVCN